MKPGEAKLRQMLRRAANGETRGGGQRERIRYIKKSQPKRTRTLLEADVPPGSLLADKTLEEIRAGHYGLQRPAVVSPRYSRAPARRARKRQAKLSRRRNRRN